VALVLLPTAFISLLAWATAGSSNGDTKDPMRAALWIWLGAHHVPFHLVLPPSAQAGLLSYLPLGALLFPLLAARSGLKRAFDRCDRDPRSLRLIRALFSIFYIGFAVLLALGSNSQAVKPIFYFVPLNSFLIVLVASIGIGSVQKRKDFSASLVALRIISVALGSSALVLGFTMVFHLQTIKNLTIVLEPGLLGAILLFILSILYMPNAILATLAYLVGPGFAVGAHTLVSPLTHRISEIPALPLLGALPTGRHPLALLSILGMIGCGVALYRSTVWHSRRALGETLFFTISLFALLSLLSSGSLLTRALGSVGVSPWKLTASISGELLLGLFLAWSIPLLVETSRNRIAK
jgi:hypothetical protein